MGNLFGGGWTEEKLDILREYLVAYLTALKKWDFPKIYIDAFAGNGEINPRQTLPNEEKDFIEGSAKLALACDFDKFVFIEKNKTYCEALENLRKEHPGKNIKIRNEDANDEIKRICQSEDWRSNRAVMFLDPYATEVEWETLKYVADTNAIDVWILAPISAIERMLPRRNTPDNYRKWSDKLDRIFGDDSWRNLYKGVETLFKDKDYSREKGAGIILELYKKRLRDAFGDRLLEESKPLINEANNRILFQFMFAAGNSNGKPIAHRIASHLINRI